MECRGQTGPSEADRFSAFSWPHRANGRALAKGQFSPKGLESHFAPDSLRRSLWPRPDSDVSGVHLRLSLPFLPIVFVTQDGYSWARKAVAESHADAATLYVKTWSTNAAAVVKSMTLHSEKQQPRESDLQLPRCDSMKEVT